MQKITNVYQNPFSDNYKDGFDLPLVPDWIVALNTPFDQVEEEMIDDLESAAADWKICAVGNLCDAIPRLESGSPNDNILNALGIYFSNYVDGMSLAFRKSNEDKYNDKRELALHTHKRIEERATEILIAMGLMDPS